MFLETDVLVGSTEILSVDPRPPKEDDVCVYGIV